MSYTIEKIDSKQIKVIRKEELITENIFTKEYLLSQKQIIQKEKDDDDTKRERQIAEIDYLLAECDKLNIA